MRRRFLRLALSFLLLVFTAASLPQAADAQAQGPTYIVQDGDTLSGIATTFGTTVDALAQANNITDPSAIQPGLKLTIPGFEGITGVLSTHTVAFGEDLATLSRQFGLSEASVMKLNHLVNPAGLYLGQQVILPQDSGRSLKGAATLLPNPGDTRLAWAVKQGVNPWALAQDYGTADKSWLLPVAPIYAPASGNSMSALPAPVLELTADPPAAIQGTTEVISVQLSGPAQLEGAMGPWPLNFVTETADTEVALQGSDALTDPGLYDLRLDVTVADGDGPTYSYSQPIKLRAGDYGFDPILNVPPDTLDPANTVPEEELVNKIVTPVTSEKMWSGPFQFPSTYYTKSFPSVFGTRRNYNGEGYTRYHTGLDFYGPAGTPILAPAKGKVVFTGPLVVRGNVTIIDHGWGVYTMYDHQSQIDVKVGDIVEPGQQIGLVGGTGRVTGPHLHWEIRVGMVPVNPLQWVQTTFP